jgi:hypothetical protein
MSNPTAFNTQLDLAKDGVFLGRVKVAMAQTAIAIQAEATSTANDNLRSKYAVAVLNTPDAYAPQFALAVVTQPDPATSQLMTSAITDSNLASVVSAVWNALAGRV